MRQSAAQPSDHLRVPLPDKRGLKVRAGIIYLTQHDARISSCIQLRESYAKSGMQWVGSSCQETFGSYGDSRWGLIRPWVLPALSAVVVGLIASGPDAPLWQVAFVVVVVFALVHAVAVLIDHARRRATASGSIGSESPQTSKEAYENRDKAKIVARAENIGPVSSEIWRLLSRLRGRSSRAVISRTLNCWIPERAFFDDPAATFRAEEAGGGIPHQRELRRAGLRAKALSMAPSLYR